MIDAVRADVDVPSVFIRALPVDCVPGWICILCHAMGNVTVVCLDLSPDLRFQS